jgi:hypothetical protein
MPNAGFGVAVMMECLRDPAQAKSDCQFDGLRLDERPG